MQSPGSLPRDSDFFRLVGVRKLQLQGIQMQMICVPLSEKFKGVFSLKSFDCIPPLLMTHVLKKSAVNY